MGDYTIGGNVASMRVPAGTSRRAARAMLYAAVSADYPAVVFEGGTTITQAARVMVCIDHATAVAARNR